MRQRGEVSIAVLIILSSLIGLTPFFAQLTSKPEPRCWSGWLYDGMNGRQIISESGGGIKCVVSEKAASL